jgi:hypothetical protein
MKKIYRKLSVILVLIITAALLPACGAGSSPAISKPALVSKVTQYEIDYTNDELPWIESLTYEYEYKDAYPVSRKMTEDGNVTETYFKYDLKDGKPVSMTRTNSSNGDTVKVSYTGEGLVDRELSFDETGRKVGEKVFQYGNRDEYFTLVLHENIISPPEEPVIDHMEETDSVIITSENGLLRKTVNDGLFANYNDEEEKEWRRFDGSYTANYGDNGILDNTTAIFATFPGSGNQYKFDLTIEDGRVTEVLRSYWVPAETQGEESSGTDSEGEGKWDPELRFTFEYTDTEISPSRYASMINYFILDGGGNYYYYNWY